MAGLLIPAGLNGKYPTRSARNIAWMRRHLRIGDGPKMGQPVEIFPYMAEDFALLWDGPVRLRNLTISRPRKNLKSFEVALIFLAALAGPEVERGAQLYSVANSRRQAMVIAKMIRQIAEQSPTIRPHLTMLTGGIIENRALDVIYEPLSSKPETAHGRNPRFVAFDELGAWNNEESELYSVMTTGSMLQNEPTFFTISTQASSDRALLSKMIDEGLRNMALPDGHPEKDPYSAVRLDTAPMSLDPFDEETIRLANPAYDFAFNKISMQAAIKAASRSPSAKAGFRWLTLNQRVSTRNNFVALDTWRRGNRPVSDDWAGCPVWCALDLSTSSDLTAFVMLARVPLPGGGHEWQVRVYAWLPDDGLEDRGKRDVAPWVRWRDEEHLLTTPGPTVDYEIVAQKIHELTAGLDVRAIACDPHRLNDLRRPLVRAGFSEEDALGKEGLFRIFRQGWGEMSSALNSLETILLNGDLAHGGHPVLGYCADNALVKPGPDGQTRRLEKKYSQHGGRIDAMVALAMATSLATQGVETTPPAGSYLDDEDSEVIFA